MTFPLVFTLLVSLTVSARPALLSSGSSKDNGGFIVYCQNLEPGVSGLYSTDYVISRDEMTQIILNSPRSLNQSLDQVERSLSKHLPKHLTSFRRFRDQLFQSADWSDSQGYAWEPGVQNLNPLQNISVGLRRQLPSSCQGQVEQAVRREDVRGLTVFHYDKSDIERLQENPLQLSFLLVHEWLWEIVEDIDSLRRLNKILHSRTFLNMSEHSANSLLWNVGFKTRCKADGPRPLITMETPIELCDEFLGATQISRAAFMECLNVKTRVRKCIQFATFFKSDVIAIKACAANTYFTSSLEVCLRGFYISRTDPTQHLSINELKQCTKGYFGTSGTLNRCLTKKLRSSD